MILSLASFDTQTAADAPVYVETHQPFVFGGIVTVWGLGGDKVLLHDPFGSAGGGQGQQTPERSAEGGEQVTAGDLVFHGTSFG